MTSQPGLQTIAIQILSYISQSKDDNQTMKFGQLIEYNEEKNLFKNYAEIEAGRKFEVKASGLQLSFNVFR